MDFICLFLLYWFPGKVIVRRCAVVAHQIGFQIEWNKFSDARKRIEQEQNSENVESRRSHERGDTAQEESDEVQSRRSGCDSNQFATVNQCKGMPEMKSKSRENVMRSVVASS